MPAPPPGIAACAAEGLPGLLRAGYDPLPPSVLRLLTTGQHQPRPIPSSRRKNFASWMQSNAACRRRWLSSPWKAGGVSSKSSRTAEVSLPPSPDPTRTGVHAPPNESLALRRLLTGTWPSRRGKAASYFRRTAVRQLRPESHQQSRLRRQQLRPSGTALLLQASPILSARLLIPPEFRPSTPKIHIQITVLFVPKKNRNITSVYLCNGEATDEALCARAAREREPRLLRQVVSERENTPQKQANKQVSGNIQELEDCASKTKEKELVIHIEKLRKLIWDGVGCTSPRRRADLAIATCFPCGYSCCFHNCNFP